MNTLRFLLIASLCGSVLFLTSCARQADSTAMVPQFASVGKTHPYSVGVEVTGGRETNPMWTSQVSNREFKTALQESLLKFRVFSRVVNTPEAEYRLDARLVRLKQPFGGFNMTVTAEVSWQLINVRSGRVVWQDTTAQEFTATVGDAFAGVNRLALANEGAIRETIKAGIERIARLTL